MEIKIYKRKFEDTKETFDKKNYYLEVVNHSSGVRNVRYLKTIIGDYDINMNPGIPRHFSELFEVFITKEELPVAQDILDYFSSKYPELHFDPKDYELISHTQLTDWGVGKKSWKE